MSDREKDEAWAYFESFYRPGAGIYGSAARGYGGVLMPPTFTAATYPTREAFDQFYDRLASEWSRREKTPFAFESIEREMTRDHFLDDPKSRSASGAGQTLR